MTPKWPSSCSHAVSSIHIQRHAPGLTVRLRTTSRRHYAQQQTSPSPPAASIAKTALTLVESNARSDRTNPPRSVFPPTLQLPERSHASGVFVYWFRVGRAYTNFYKEGIKAVWYNYRAASLLQKRMMDELGAKDRIDAATRGLITRSEWQLLARNSHDISKLPFFGVMVVVFGEWLALIVPFVPGIVPATCLIPKQAMDMRVKAEDRRRASFRQGITEPLKEQFPDDRLVVAGRLAERAVWPMADVTFVRSVLDQLRADQLHHLSSTLGLHSRFWDRVQLPPPTLLLRRALTKRLQYLTLDDKLFLKDGGARELNSVELEIACQERGLDTLGKKESVWQDNLGRWLKRQSEDEGRGRAMLGMLFKR